MKAYEVVLRHVEEAILAGQLSVGDLLPPERELAQQLGVSRSATREAIRALEAQGVLTSSVGAGPGSGTRVTDQQSKALTKLLRLQVALANFPVGDVVELRVALERVSVTLAAQRISEPALRRLRGVLDAMASPAVGLDAFNELDTEFHVLMSQAADNRLITDMTVAVRESMRLPILRASRQMGTGTPSAPTFSATMSRSTRPWPVGTPSGPPTSSRPTSGSRTRSSPWLPRQPDLPPCG